MEHRSATGRPLSKRSLNFKLEKIIGFRPGKRWITKFLSRHPTIRLGKPSGLDPLRAKCFNKANIDQHFDELEEVLEKKGIPWCNVYNMDEKGCQRGGGRRMSQSNSSYLAHIDPTTSFIVETCSSRRSLSVSVRMAPSSHLALFFRESNSTKSGFLISQKAFGKSY